MMNLRNMWNLNQMVSSCFIQPQLINWSPNKLHPNGDVYPIKSPFFLVKWTSSYGFPMIFNGFHHFPMVFLWFSHAFPMIFQPRRSSPGFSPWPPSRAPRCPWRCPPPPPGPGRTSSASDSPRAPSAWRRPWRPPWPTRHVVSYVMNRTWWVHGISWWFNGTWLVI